MTMRNRDLQSPWPGYLCPAPVKNAGLVFKPGIWLPSEQQPTGYRKNILNFFLTGSIIVLYPLGWNTQHFSHTPGCMQYFYRKPAFNEDNRNLFTLISQNNGMHGIISPEVWRLRTWTATASKICSVLGNGNNWGKKGIFINCSTGFLHHLFPSSTFVECDNLK